ncbi:MAG TPA: hypothetical protein VIC26_11390 [Marinagarivorans sp.]
MQYLAPVQATLFIVSLVMFGGLLLWSLLTANWRALVAVNHRWRMWVLAACFLGLLWGFVGIGVELSFRVHPMLMSSMALIFGFRLSFVAGCISLLLSLLIVLTQLSQQPLQLAEVSNHVLWHNYAINGLLGVALPAGVTTFVLTCIAKIHVQNLFIYILGGGFVGGILSMLLVGGASLTVLTLFGEPSAQLMMQNSHLFALLLFPEGFCNGAIVSAVAVFAPHWVKTYDHDFYLKE